MKLAMIGLGKMGANMVRRLSNDGHDIVAFDLNIDSASELASELNSVDAAMNLQELLAALPKPRVIWMMVPHEFVDNTIVDLIGAGLEKGDLLKSGIHYVDSGTSGGIWGLENGYSIMVGGSDEAISIVKPVIESLAPAKDKGWGHVGPAGAGHYVKMVHNGIEYGMMQAFAEGFEMLDAKQDMNLDLAQISEIWQHGSVVRSWLLDLMADAFNEDTSLSALSDYVDDSGEGRWTVHDSIDLGVPTPVLTLALQMRFRSRQDPSFGGKVLNAMRAGFGGHSIRSAE